MSAPPPSSLRAAKQALRKEMRGHLKAITEDSLQQQATATTARLLALPAYTEARRLSVYLTMPKGELRTDEIVKHALSHGKDVFVPFTKIPEQPDTMKMLKLRSLQDFESLQPNAWKIPEHETAEGMQEALDPDNDGLDLIVLPGLAFDRSRTRLGHGKGYYDRYLALVELWTKTRGVPMPATVALALDEQIREAALPSDATDRKPDVVVHSSGLISADSP